MTNKVYVGGLSYATTEKQLEDLFAAYGTVESARVIMDKFSGRSKGFWLCRDEFRCRSPESDPGFERD